MIHKKISLFLMTGGVGLFAWGCWAFSDVGSQDMFKAAIDFLEQKGIVQGYPDGTFRADSPLNRAELLKIIIGSKYPDVSAFSGQKCFWDVDPNAWYTRYACFAKRAGVVKGYTDGSFRPSQYITAAEGLKIAMVTYGFQYSEAASPWYADLVAKAVQSQFVPMNINSWESLLNRGQMADLLTRMLKYQDGTLNKYLNNLSSSGSELPLPRASDPVPTPVPPPTPLAPIVWQKGLSWPIDCAPGISCSFNSFPDPDKDGKDAFCKNNTYSGHTGTDIGVSQAQMDAGVDVLATADGVVKWTFDGKYDLCPNSNQPDCPSDKYPNGGQVCTEAGPYCGDGTNGQSCIWCFGGGNVVVILHQGVPGVFATAYEHLKKYSIIVKPGQLVKRGQKIAQVGSAGSSSGAHLHFGVWGAGYYDVVDPWHGACSPAGHQSLWEDQWQNVP